MAGSNLLTVNGAVSGNGTWTTGVSTTTISLTGNWTFNGTSVGNNATAVFTGSGNQSLSGIITTGTGALTITKTGGTVTMGSEIKMTGPFTLNSGTFDPGTNKLSSASGTINGGTLRVGTATWGGNYLFSPAVAAGATIEYYASSPTINGSIIYQNLKFSGNGTAGVSSALTIQGNLTNTSGGILDFGSNDVILSGTVSSNSIAGFSTYGSVSMTKTAGTATFTGDVKGSNLIINGNGGTLDLGEGLTQTFSGNLSLMNGTLDGGSSIFKLANDANISGGTFYAGTGTVDYNGQGQQSIGNLTYFNVTLSGSSVLNFAVGTDIRGTLAIGGTAKVNTETGQIIPVGNLLIEGVPAADGTWGSNQSPATNKDQNHFSGGGILSVADLRPTPLFSAITASQSICFGTSAVTLSGILSASGPIYPVNGENVKVTLNGVTQNAPVTGGAGAFSVIFNTSALPVSATTYTITYAYGGDLSLQAAANNSSTNLTVNPVTVINSQSTGTQTQDFGGIFNPITVTASGAGTLTYKWYSATTAVNTGGTLLGSANGGETSSYIPQTTVAGTQYYYCVVTGTCGSVTSQVSGAIIVNPVTAGGTISGAATGFCQGGSTGTMTLSGYTGTILRWERQLGSAGWVSVGNYGVATYSEIPYAGGTWQYRAVVQNGQMPLAYSSVATVIVYPLTVVGWLAGSTPAICEGESLGVLTLGSSTGNILRWEKRINSGPWTNISNTLNTYSEIPSASGTWEYRVLVQSGNCSALYSNNFSVFVNPTLSITLGQHPVICKHTTTALLAYTSTTGNPTAYSINFDGPANSAGMADVTGWGFPASPIPINVPWDIASGVYNGILTVATNYPVCSSAGYPITVTVGDNTQSFVITGSTAPCLGSSQTYTTTNINGVIYNWTFPSGWVQTGGGTTNSVTVTVGPGSGNVQLAPIFTCGSGTVQTLAVTPAPLPSGTISYPNSPYCKNLPGQPVTSTVTAGGAYSSTAGLNLDSATGAITPSLSTPGTYTVTYTILPAGGCGLYTTSASVTIFSDLVWTGTISTDWNNVGNWSCGYLPDLTTNVLIPNVTNKPVLSSGAVGAAKNIVINGLSSLTVIGNTLQIAGTIANSGTFTATSGTIEMKGSAAQTIGANVFANNTILNLTVSNSAGVTLQGALNISGIVKAATGDLSSAGNLTLLSTELQTALIDGTGTAGVLGNVTLQRYLPSAFGYKYFSSPFNTTSVNAFSTWVDLEAVFPTFYKYDENNQRDSSGVIAYQSGWVKYLAGTLTTMSGYAANFGTSPVSKTVGITGVVNNGAYQLTLLNHNRKYTKGFNLVGNPYPSPIDWNAGSGWTKSNIDNAVYFFNAGNTNQYTGVYSSYVNGISTGNGNNIIAAMQGFFVHVSDGSYPVSATLGTTNAVRINNLAPLFRDAIMDDRTILRFGASFETKNAIEDVTVIYLDSQADQNFDKTGDALKMANTDVLVPNIYSLSQDIRQLSINGLALSNNGVTRIPIGISTLSDGWINFTARDIGLLPASVHIYLVDNLKGITQDLKQLPGYRFYLRAGVYEQRFQLVLSPAPVDIKGAVAEKMFSVSGSASTLMVQMNLPSNAKGSLMVTNMSGQVILRREVFEQETVEINPYGNSGVFIITVISGNRMASEKILIRKDYE
jgi:hypothetical protein